uniref:Uncharacterized protein n=1 Tax=Chromera velia CCMP2878 TaxID=1169474 RepID=A0A0G4HQZ7_9ALVE|eukprot:Cvel_30425.t1-p1 / transcript=Cvel_30425.t1 / gene=Cvel_30425 / organism=Chromera_velia_CCMP2878 / gene_product=hypothetical protein / transcript_product=hypothetical protein / location=Cvel_scaffold4335:7850-8594(+) / protein_length=179 / sequence_SO=supercontig / SO=protein_coding / is_pseudo=false
MGLIGINGNPKGKKHQDRLKMLKEIPEVSRPFHPGMKVDQLILRSSLEGFEGESAQAHMCSSNFENVKAYFANAPLDSLKMGGKGEISPPQLTVEEEVIKQNLVPEKLREYGICGKGAYFAFDMTKAVGYASMRYARKVRDSSFNLLTFEEDGSHFCGLLWGDSRHGEGDVRSPQHTRR